MVKVLLDHGAAVNFKDRYGRTPMHILAIRFHDRSETEVECAVIEMLIVNGAELEARDTSGRTPMHCVRSAQMLYTLLKDGADICARDI